MTLRGHMVMAIGLIAAACSDSQDRNSSQCGKACGENHDDAGANDSGASSGGGKDSGGAGDGSEPDADICGGFGTCVTKAPKVFELVFEGSYVLRFVEDDRPYECYQLFPSGLII